MAKSLVSCFLTHGVEVAFGLTNTALEWIRSFVADRTQQVSYCGRLSPIQRALFGVPQGSVLGPLLYCNSALGAGECPRAAATTGGMTDRASSWSFLT